MIDGLIFKGGGIKGLAYVGALEEYVKYENIDTVKYLGGTSSAGSIVATLLASNHTLKEINDILYSVDWNQLKDESFGYIRNTIRLFTKYGYHKGNYFEKFINKVLFNKYNLENMTFKQLFETTKKYLKMVGTNVTTGETIHMDYIHTPNMSVAKAVRISSTIPFMFKPVEINNELYVDSGFTSNSDFGMFDEIKYINIIAFDLGNFYFKKTKRFCLKTFIQSIVNIGARNNVTTYKENVHICKIFEGSIDPMSFDLVDEDKNYLKLIGRNAFIKFLYKS